MKRWIHVSFAWPAGGEAETFEAVFDKAVDWFKYSRNCYFIYTGKDIDDWRERVSNIRGMQGKNVVVLEIDVEGLSGYLPEWMWKRLRDKG
jgi:hypothetical protein